MKTKIVVIAIICMALCSCTAVIHSFQGNYSNSHTITTNTSYDEVWDNVIDFFASSGITISTMEKASGLIVASKILVPLTIEKNGKPLDPTAYVVIPNVKFPVKNATVTFNVRVRDNGDSVAITINMHDIDASHWAGLMYSELYSIEGKSTGVFENSLLNLFQ